MEAVAITHQTPHAIRASIELVTPDRAAKMLERNTHNRPLSKPYVRELRRELEEGRFKTTHQGVAFSPTGALIDGQHRLTAIVESGVSAELLVAEGVAEDAFDAIDQHRKRTGGQILAMAGVVKDAPRMVAMARAILQVVYGNSRVSNTAAAEYAVAHQTELELFLAVAKRFTPAVGAAFAWCASLGWHETLDAAERLVTNGPWEEPQEMDPMRALANRSRDFSKLGTGGTGIKGRFDVALNCLQALHENRGLKVARSSRPDYAALEAASIAPGEMTEREPARRKSLQSLMAQAEGRQTPERQSRIDYDSYNDQLEERTRAAEAAFDDSDLPQITGASLAPSLDPELAEAVAAEVAKSKRRSRASE